MFSNKIKRKKQGWIRLSKPLDIKHKSYDSLAKTLTPNSQDLHEIADDVKYVFSIKKIQSKRQLLIWAFLHWAEEGQNISVLKTW